MSKVTCPGCGYEFEVEVRVAEPEKPRRWRRWALAALAIVAIVLAAGICAWLRGL